MPRPKKEVPRFNIVEECLLTHFQTDTEFGDVPMHFEEGDDNKSFEARVLLRAKDQHGNYWRAERIITLRLKKESE